LRIAGAPGTPGLGGHPGYERETGVLVGACDGSDGVAVLDPETFGLTIEEDRPVLEYEPGAP
jgi:hypothetical protein